MVSVSLFLRIEMAYKPVLAKKSFIYKHQYPKYRLFVYRVKVCDVLFEFFRKISKLFRMKSFYVLFQVEKSPSYFLRNVSMFKFTLYFKEVFSLTKVF